MNRKSLEKKCVERFREDAGRRLFDFMLKIANLDFCVATAWNSDQVSIARSCKMRGKIFRTTADYKSIILPDHQQIPLERLAYSDITHYLPKSNSYGEVEHCHFDQP